MNPSSLNVKTLGPTVSSSSVDDPLRKSLRKIKEKSHQDFYNNRIAKAKNIFMQQGYSLEAPVTESEILELLDTLGKRPFDREVAAQLFEKIPMQENEEDEGEQTFCLQEFIDTHIKAEYLLLLQADEIEGELNEVDAKIEALKEEYEKAVKRNEVVIETNSLQVDIVEVVCDEERYEPEVGSVFSVLLVVDNYKYETEGALIETAKFNPKFNRSFHIRLQSPEELVKILLRDQYRFSEDENYSDLSCTINLGSYRDQVKHVTWLTLYNKFGQSTKFKVNVVIQWQFSKIAHYEDKLIELEQVEERLIGEKEHVRLSLKELVAPFAHALQVIKRSSSDKK